MARPGTWDLELDGDFRVADGWELVHLLRQTAAGAYAAPVGPIFALRESLNKRTVGGPTLEGATDQYRCPATKVP
jgi:hypothetical protein